MRQNIKYLRDSGRKIIIDRLKAMKDGDYVPNDILSSILNNWSNFYNIKIFYSMLFFLLL